MKKFRILCFILTTFFFSCTKDYVKTSTPNKILTFSADIYPIITSYNCTDCHVAGGGIYDFSSDPIAYNDLLSYGLINTSSPSSSRFYIAVTPSAPMGMQMSPGGPSLTSSEQATILAWIQLGAVH
jgi:hypothetical protein